MSIAPYTAATADAGPTSAAAASEHSTRFRFVDALRGLAAFGIVLHHLNLYGPLRDPISRLAPLWVLWTDEACWIGVQIFFVIAGS